MALGAQRETVQGMVLWEGGGWLRSEFSAGCCVSVGLTMLLRSMLFGVQEWDVATFAAVAVVLGAAAMLASYVPARRAAWINPVEALRAE
jgi:macrolide transport system ATP-binding/permease protein